MEDFNVFWEAVSKKEFYFYLLPSFWSIHRVKILHVIGKETSQFCQAQNIEASFWCTCTLLLDFSYSSSCGLVLPFGCMGLTRRLKPLRPRLDGGVDWGASARLRLSLILSFWSLTFRFLNTEMYGGTWHRYLTSFRSHICLFLLASGPGFGIKYQALWFKRR